MLKHMLLRNHYVIDKLYSYHFPEGFAISFSPIIGKIFISLCISNIVVNIVIRIFSLSYKRYTGPLYKKDAHLMVYLCEIEYVALACGIVCKAPLFLDAFLTEHRLFHIREPPSGSPYWRIVLVHEYPGP